ncbi:MAG: hypothetical protein Q9227_008558 [Pyrenula ochraceoflavens]
MPAYPNYATPTPPAPYNLPAPTSSGTVDVGGIKPVKSGSVSIADAIAKARGIAAEKGVSYDPSRVRPRNDDPRSYRRSRSPSPPRPLRDNFRDNYNPYRDERRGMADRGYHRDRSLSPPGRGHRSPMYNMNEDRQSSNRARNEEDMEVLPIERNMVGLIIGRAGENLRRVESSTGARVQFTDGPESGGPTRHCRITGSRAARASAKAEIFRIMDENGERGNDRSRGQRSQPPASTEGDNTMKIMVPDRTVGLIIGRGGETIRDLQERSGCHVNIMGENKSVNGLRPVNLIGSIQAQERAQALIYEVVESDTNGTVNKPQENRRGRESQQDNSGDKSSDRVMVPGEAVGMIIGKGGESIKEMQNQTGCKINVSPASGRDIEREIGLVGTRHAIELARRAIMEKVDVVESRNRGDSHDQRDNSYGNQYSQPSYEQSAPGQPPQAPPGGEDLYAAYGGYQNYIAMWYAAVQQSQQQPGGQAPGEQPGPPGAS